MGLRWVGYASDVCVASTLVLSLLGGISSALGRIMFDVTYADITRSGKYRGVA